MDTMTELQPRIVTLPSMRVATFRATGSQPELEAWNDLRAWAEPRGLLNDPQKHPVFGFNNPSPSPDRPDYGYELWIRIDPDTDVGDDVESKDFTGGRYAVVRCRLVGDPRGTILDMWHALGDWVQDSPHEWRQTHELEQVVDPRVPEQDFELDLYLPIL